MGDFGYSKQSLKTLLGVTAGEVVGDTQTATLTNKTINDITLSGAITSGDPTEWRTPADNVGYRRNVAGAFGFEIGSDHASGGAAILDFHVNNSGLYAMRFLSLDGGNMYYSLATPTGTHRFENGNINVNNNMVYNFRNQDAAKTGAYTLTDDDNVLRADASGGAFTLTLPAASGRTGKIYNIIRTDVAFSTNALTIDANASELINGNLTYVLWTGESITIECTGTAWECIHQPEPTDVGYNFLRGSTLNRRYIAGLSGSNAVLLTSTTGPTVNTLYAMPFFVSRTTKFDTIEYELTTQGAGSQVRLGVYFDNGNGYPGKLLFGSADVTGTNPAGAKVATITAASQVFNPGLYWLAYENSATIPQIRCLPATECITIGGFASPFSTTPPGLCWTVAHTVGALPDPYTAGGTLRTAVSAVGSPIPAVGLRAV